MSSISNRLVTKVAAFAPKGAINKFVRAAGSQATQPSQPAKSILPIVTPPQTYAQQITSMSEDNQTLGVTYRTSSAASAVKHIPNVIAIHELILGKEFVVGVNRSQMNASTKPQPEAAHKKTPPRSAHGDTPPSTKKRARSSPDEFVLTKRMRHFNNTTTIELNSGFMVINREIPVDYKFEELNGGIFIESPCVKIESACTSTKQGVPIQIFKRSNGVYIQPPPDYRLGLAEGSGVMRVSIDPSGNFKISNLALIRTRLFDDAPAVSTPPNMIKHDVNIHFVHEPDEDDSDETIASMHTPEYGVSAGQNDGGIFGYDDEDSRSDIGQPPEPIQPNGPGTSLLPSEPVKPNGPGTSGPRPKPVHPSGPGTSGPRPKPVHPNGPGDHSGPGDKLLNGLDDSFERIFGTIPVRDDNNALVGSVAIFDGDVYVRLHGRKHLRFMHIPCGLDLDVAQSEEGVYKLDLHLDENTRLRAGNKGITLVRNLNDTYSLIGLELEQTLDETEALQMKLDGTQLKED